MHKGQREPSLSGLRFLPNGGQRFLLRSSFSLVGILGFILSFELAPVFSRRLFFAFPPSNNARGKILGQPLVEAVRSSRVDTISQRRACLEMARSWRLHIGGQSATFNLCAPPSLLMLPRTSFKEGLSCDFWGPLFSPSSSSFPF